MEFAASAPEALERAKTIADPMLDECLQLFGGYGYVQEYPISRIFIDSRIQKIYGGTNEIMKLLIARSM